MTLNIILATRDSIHVASDFRLTTVGHKSTISDHSPKILTIYEDNFSACISYCGIGSWKGRETYLWLKGWLEKSRLRLTTFDDAAAVIRSEASHWLRETRMAYTNFYLGHSFLVAGFASDKATIALISNYDSLREPKPSDVLDECIIDKAEIAYPRVVIAGQEAAVPRSDRRSLLSIAVSQADPTAVRRRLARVVAGASASPASHGTVSASCYTYSLFRGGIGEGELHGGATGRLVPVWLEKGIDWSDLINLRPVPGKQIQLVSTKRVVFAPGREISEEVCRPEIVQPHTPGQKGAFSLAELPSLGGPTSRAYAINQKGQVVGCSYLKAGGPSHACLWSEDGEARDLGTLGRSSSTAKGINDQGQIVGSSINASRENHAFLWTDENGMRDLGTLGGVASDATAINNSGHVVGASWTLPGRSPGDKIGRAFLWTDSEGMISLGALDGGTSRAFGINDMDQVVGNSASGNLVRAFFWSRAEGMIDIGGFGGQFSRAVSINSYGQVVGISMDKDDKLQPFVWTLEDGISRLPLDQDSLILKINDSGTIIYNKVTDLGTRSFMWSQQSGSVPLPWYEWHQAGAQGINNQGVIVGQAWKGEHAHALRWSAV